MEQTSLASRMASLKRRRAQRHAYLLMGFAALLFVLALGVSFVAVSRAQGRHKPTTQEQDLVDLTNAARARENLPPLRLDQSLSVVAKTYAIRKAQQPDMELPAEEVLRQEMTVAGYQYRQLHMTLNGYQDLTVPAIFDSLLQDDGTRGQTLAEEYEDIGIAVVQGEDQRFYLAIFIATKSLP